MKVILNGLWEKVYGWFEGFLLMLPNLVVAIVVMVMFVLLARFLRKVFTKMITRFSENKAVVRLVANLITFTLVIVGLFVALGILNLDKTVTSLLAGAGVMGLAIGLAFQDPLLNIISGVLLSMRDVPFVLGDLIKTNDHYGHVKRITLRTTIIQSLTGEDIIVPNKSVVQNSIINYSFSKNRRVDVDCGVDYASDLEEVQRITIETIEKHVDYLKDREIEFMYTEFGESSINFTLRYWIEETGEKDFLTSRGRAIIAIKKAFDQNGINIPFPIRTLEFSQKAVVEGIGGKQS